jgi:hypothetical protein
VLCRRYEAREGEAGKEREMPTEFTLWQLLAVLFGIKVGWPDVANLPEFREVEELVKRAVPELGEPVTGDVAEAVAKLDQVLAPPRPRPGPPLPMGDCGFVLPRLRDHIA